MKMSIIEIEIYNSDEKMLSTISVKSIDNNVFKTIANEIIDNRLVYDTEFKTKINSLGQHEIESIITKSKFVTRRFSLSTQFQEEEYRLLGDEIVKHGGFWQVDFGNIATINIPKDGNLDIDEIFNIFNFHPQELKD